MKKQTTLKMGQLIYQAEIYMLVPVKDRFGQKSKNPRYQTGACMTYTPKFTDLNEFIKCLKETGVTMKKSYKAPCTRNSK